MDFDLKERDEITKAYAGRYVTALDAIGSETPSRSRSTGARKPAGSETHSRRSHSTEARKSEKSLNTELKKEKGSSSAVHHTGSSKNRAGSLSVNSEPFHLFFKGLVSKERIKSKIVDVAGIGVVIFDSINNVVLEVKKPVAVKKETIVAGESVEQEALMEGLDKALALNIKRIVVVCDDPKLHHILTSMGVCESKTCETCLKFKISALLLKWLRYYLRGRFLSYELSIPEKGDNDRAYKLARDAILSQISWPLQTTSGTIWKETCAICLEDVNVEKMFSVDDCLQRFCFSCVKKHVESKLRQGILPKCPFEGCENDLKINSCSKVLPQDLVQFMDQRIKEASIPITERIYCPYPRCSTPMSKHNALTFSEKKYKNAKESGVRECIKCSRSFCVHCKVAWHFDMSCVEYTKSRLYLSSEDAVLKSIATEKLWRQCKKCSHMIELTSGCFHITCRCGYEFCYTCGSEYRKKKPTCTCQLWDERYIIHN